MKTLYLCRHAKSSWEESGLPDEQRPVTPKGVRKTEKVIKFLKKKNVLPGLIITSHAVRAYETALLIAEGLDYPPERIITDRKIYDGYYDRILDVIYGTKNDIDSLMIFGHNPTITHLANLFLHPGIDVLPTSAVVSISFNTDQWESIPTAEARKEFIVYPKMLK
jgi:phosphohistidine phosphatase